MGSYDSLFVTYRVVPVPDVTALSRIDAVHRAAVHTEAKGHHPDIDIRRRAVTFNLDMAEDISELLL